MHILFYHDAIIPPKKYGGTERVIFRLIQALNQLGHQTTLIAKRGSQIDGTTIIPLVENKPWQSLIPDDVDFLHLWSSPSSSLHKPFLVTIEGNGQPNERFHPNTIFISKKHAENHGSTHYVYNGLNPDSYISSDEREDYLVFLAKASWKVKNLKGAIQIARKAGLPLEVLGSRDWPLGLQRLLPRIRGVRYHGMVDDVKKRAILSKARALLFPVRWHEPFGIAIAEALASGCPVIGTPYGSLSEIITPEVGVLSNKGQELVRSLSQIDRFSPKKCRQRVYEGFTHLDMAKSYLKYYENILAHGRLENTEDSSIPITKSDAAGLSAQSLLDWSF